MSSNQERVALLTTSHNTASEKLDYFILGVSLAICAYLAQTNPYGRIGINIETFLLVSLLAFAASAVFGFLRIEAMIKTIRLNVFALDQKDPRATAFYLEKLRGNCQGHKYYRARNTLLIAGLGCYLATKIWAAY
jgi:hypothetical protein